MFLRSCWLSFSFKSRASGLCNWPIRSICLKFAIWPRFFNFWTIMYILIDCVDIFTNIYSARPYNNFLFHLFYLLQEWIDFFWETFLHSWLPWVITIMVSPIICVSRITSYSRTFISYLHALPIISLII